MCGIVGYIGRRSAGPILLEGLKRLEYRGYDSAGIALIDGGLHIWRTPGRISNLEARLAPESIDHPRIGVAHTRWATHGAPTENNAHPHRDRDGKVALVHNGIIENHQTLKSFLLAKGIECVTETDTEVLAQLVGYYFDGDLEGAVRTALIEVKGAYGVAVISPADPDRLVVACKGSPLIVGVGNDEYIVASDSAAIVQHTSRIFRLADGEISVLSRDGLATTTLDAAPVTKEITDAEVTFEEIELGEYSHFMEKEIFEQPRCLRDAMRGRLDSSEEKIKLGGLAACTRELARARRLVLTGCGTAWHACLVGEYLIEELARLPCDVEYASEFRYRNPIIEEGTAVLAVSQSGETADTLAAVREAKEKGALVLGMVNSVGSAIPRETDAGVYLHVGPEIGVASTKAFTGQLTIFSLLALYLGRRRHLAQSVLARHLKALSEIPEQISEVLDQSDPIRKVAEKYVDRENWLFLGRGYNFPTALEGALKLKEISYIHAEGLPGAEIKHGPIALINEGMPVVVIATRNSQYPKIAANIEEVRTRKGRVIAVATEGDREIQSLADDIFYVPDTLEPLQPLLAVIPLQLLAYHAALLRGCNVDKPRNLAKSVTVE